MTNLQVGVKVFLKNPQGKFLLVKRNVEKYKNVSGVWDIVGGRIEPGKTLIENLVREVKEETGLEITSTPKLLAAQDIIPNEEKHIVRLSYVADTKSEPVLDTTENVDFQWLSIEDMKSLPEIDKYVKEILDSNLI